jgi:hypothetical protein
VTTFDDAETDADGADGQPRVRVVRRGMRAITAWKAAVIGLVAFCLLGSGSLVQAARGQNDSWQRTATLDVADTIDRVSNFLSLNRPLDWINGRLHRSDHEPTVVIPPTTLPPSPGSTTTTIPPRIISTAQPLRIRVFGDSQGFDLGDVLKSTVAGNALIHADFDAKVSTGLARPDFYNWPARMQENLVREDADVVVIMIGANDDQNLMDITGNRVAVKGTPEWPEEYRTRVAGVMDLLNDNRRKVVWIGEPLVGRPELNQTLQMINGIVSSEAAKRPWVTWVDTTKLLAGPNGEYVDYLTQPGKAAIRCRAADEVHLTLGCDQLVVDQAMDVIRTLFPAIAPTPTTTTTTTTTEPPTVPAPTAPPATRTTR